MDKLFSMHSFDQDLLSRFSERCIRIARDPLTFARMSGGSWAGLQPVFSLDKAGTSPYNS